MQPLFLDPNNVSLQRSHVLAVVIFSIYNTVTRLSLGKCLSVCLPVGLAPLHRFYIVSEALYNIHLCKAFQCFIPLREGATSSQIKSLGSIQVTWQLYPHFCFSTTTWENAQCFCICLTAPPTILQLGRSMVVGHVWTVHTCSFMCTKHIDVIAYPLAFLQVGEHFGIVAFSHVLVLSLVGLQLPSQR